MHDFIRYLREQGVIDSTKAETFHTIGKTRLLFGVIALRRGFIDFDQLQEVLEEKAAGGNKEVRVGELMLRKGYMTGEQVDTVLKEQKQDAELPPELLLETGLLPKKILEEHLEKFYRA